MIVWSHFIFTVTQSFKLFNHAILQEKDKDFVAMLSSMEAGEQVRTLKASSGFYIWSSFILFFFSNSWQRNQAKVICPMRVNTNRSLNFIAYQTVWGQSRLSSLSENCFLQDHQVLKEQTLFGSTKIRINLSFMKK